MATKNDASVTDISQKVKDFIAYLNISNNAFAKLMGTSNARISKIVNGTVPYADFLQDMLRKHPDLNPAWLIGNDINMIREKVLLNQVEQEQFKIPIIDKESEPFYIKHLKMKDKLNQLPFMMVQDLPNRIAFEMNGDSMEPMLYSGDLLICNQLPKEAWPYIRQGVLYVIVTEDYGVLIQNFMTYYKKERMIGLQPVNPDYAQIAMNIDCIRKVWVAELKLTSKVSANAIFALDSRLTNLEKKINSFKPSQNFQN